MYSYASIYFPPRLHINYVTLEIPLYIFTPVGDSLVVD